MSRLLASTILASVAFMISVRSVWADPRSPDDERKTFRVVPGLEIQLVAAEPDVVDPVAMCFDHRGRIYVCEMRGYPNGGTAIGMQTAGRIRRLEDRDGDGRFETSVVFAEGLRFPTGILPWRSGVIVTVAPDILFLPDENDDGKADLKKVLYTGFGLDNIQQIVNTPTFTPDNWVHCVCGSSGGSVTCPDMPGMKPLVLRGRGVRFDPDRPGSIEPVSGGGQYGLTSDHFFHWFTATNSQHLRQIVLPDHYLRRNEHLAVGGTTLDIAEHGAACRVFRISPFEAWRVERTTRRKDGPEAKRLPPNELVPGGYATSTCSPLFYGDSVLPGRYRGAVYICDPANNAVIADRITPLGSRYTANRLIDGEQEFLASTDNWFRPVSLTTGPDGAMYLLDFYREVIETPLSLPDDIKKRLNLESRDRGRIWRITHADPKERSRFEPYAAKPTAADLVAGLDSDSAWRRVTALRLIAESFIAERAISELRSKEIAAQIVTAYPTMRSYGKVTALSALYRLGALTPEIVATALGDSVAGVIEHGVRVSEPFLSKSEELQRRVVALAKHPSGFVRLQVAFSAAYLPADKSASVLRTVLTDPEADSWLVGAALSSSGESAAVMLQSLARDPQVGSRTSATINRLAVMVGSRSKPTEVSDALVLVGAVHQEAVARAILDGLAQGMQFSGRPLNKLWNDPRAEWKPAVDAARKMTTKAVGTAQDEAQSIVSRSAAVRLLTVASFPMVREPLQSLLNPRQPAEIQSAALQALGRFDEKEAAELLLGAWPTMSPSLRREAMEILFARADRIPLVLDAVEKGIVVAAQLDRSRRDALRGHTTPAIRLRAEKLLAAEVNADRKKIVDQYREALTLSGDAVRGKVVFQKNCTACHRLDNVGFEVGADLRAALRNKTKEALLVDILDPNREVDSRFVNYLIDTDTGKRLSGILAVETPTSITLRRGEKAEDTVPRKRIEEIRSTGKSLMPEEFEKAIDPRQLADLLEYLLGSVKP